jgi:type IV secretory pathway VirB2 component (pilin)
MNQILVWLQGKKTYFSALVSAVAGAWAYLHGKESFSQAVQNVPGLLVYLGAIAASLRAAVSKVETAVKVK